MRALLVAMLFVAGQASAHSKINSTTPSNGEVIASVPEVVEMQFGNKLRLVKVEMTHEDHPTVDLDISAYKSFENSFSIPMNKMGAGTYKLEWRGLGVDGHALSGEFSFEVE